ncbi:MAG: hypothetical protein CL843_18200 [Crocinitomicaceae bacterium]|nr:hypothetical protein [Crocinitomicaceae bacterium]
MIKYFISSILLILITTSNCQAQWIEMDTNYLSYPELINKHSFGKFMKGMAVYNCCLPTDNPNDSIIGRFHLLKNQTDLIQYELIDDKGNVLETGFYRKLYQLPDHDPVAIYVDMPLCWHKDLVWHSFDSDGKLIKIEYYNRGELIQPRSFYIKE